MARAVMEDLPIDPESSPVPGVTLKRHNLSLTDFEVLASIGIHDFERAGRQRLFICVRLFLDPAVRASGDDIATAVDYDFLRAGISALVAGRHYNLQETLVEDILTLCAGWPGVTGAWVSSRKPDVYPDCAAVGYEAEAEFAPGGGMAGDELLEPGVAEDGG